MGIKVSIWKPFLPSAGQYQVNWTGWIFSETVIRWKYPRREWISHCNLSVNTGKNIGKPLLVVLQDDKNMRGELLDADDQGISIRLEQGAKKQSPVDTYIVYQDIKKSKVLVTFK
jgi:hypothetical protein